MTGTPQEPEGTQLVTQLGDAVGGPEVPGPDPETETVDLRRKLWNVQRLGESMAEDRDETVRRCGEQVLAVLGDAAEPDELAALRRSVRILAGITARNHQVMEAARIEMGQNGPHAAMQWILNALPDVWDDDETAWDGKESAEEWFDRTESFYRAAEPPGTPSPSPAAGSPAAVATDAGEGKDGTEGDEGRG